MVGWFYRTGITIAYHHLPYGGTIAEHKPNVKTAITIIHFASLSPSIIPGNVVRVLSKSVGSWHWFVGLACV